jgi:hypothetical protein
VKPLSRDDVARCRAFLERGEVPLETLPKYVGDRQLGDGFWRFFSPAYPTGGVTSWNAASTWKQAWSMPEDAVFAFGEDLFGNQLVIPRESDSAAVWNHESGELVDLLLPPLELLETCIDSGLDWIDFYTPAVLEVGRVRRGDVPEDSHLHWTTPLILGGVVVPSNTSVVERRAHLLGHADLWRQLAGLDPGTAVVIKPTPS